MISPSAPRSRGRRALRARTLALVTALAAGATRPAAAQEMEIPVAIQVPLFLKVLSFDRRHESARAEGGNGSFSLAARGFGVVFQSGNRASVVAKDEVMHALGQATVASGMTAVAIDLDAQSIEEAIARAGVGVLYVAPLRAADIARIARASRTAGVTTLTGVPEYVRLGLAIGVRLQGERPKLLINLTASRQEGAELSAELLKLAHVYR